MAFIVFKVYSNNEISRILLVTIVSFEIIPEKGKFQLEQFVLRCLSYLHSIRFCYC